MPDKPATVAVNRGPAAFDVDEGPVGNSRLGRDTLLNVAPRVSTILIALLLSPYIVSKVGLEAFGFWSIIQAVVAYAQIADGGLPLVATRYIATAQANGDLQRQRDVIAFTCSLMLALGLGFVGIVIMIVVCVPRGWSADLPQHWTACSIMGAGAFCCTFLGRSLAAVPHGHHRWDLEARTTMAVQLAGALTTVAALELGTGLTGLGLGALVGGLTMVTLYLRAAHRLVGLEVRGMRIRFALWKEMREQGGNLQIVSLVAATNAQADRLLLLPFASLAWIGAYSLGARIAVALRALPVAAFGPLIAHLSAVESVGGTPAVRGEYERSLSVVIRVGLGGLLIAYAGMYPAVLAWLGGQHKISAAAASVLGVGYAVNVMTGPGTAAAIASGKAQLDRDYNLLGLAINVVLTAVLGVCFGGWGVVAATTLGLFVSSIWLLSRIDRWLETSWLQALRLQLKSLGVVSGLSVAVIVTTIVVASDSRALNLGISTVFVGAGVLVIGGRAFSVAVVARLMYYARSVLIRTSRQ